MTVAVQTVFISWRWKYVQLYRSISLPGQLNWCSYPWGFVQGNGSRRSWSFSYLRARFQRRFWICNVKVMQRLHIPTWSVDHIFLRGIFLIAKFPTWDIINIMSILKCYRWLLYCNSIWPQFVIDVGGSSYSKWTVYGSFSGLVAFCLVEKGEFIGQGIDETGECTVC